MSAANGLSKNIDFVNYKLDNVHGFIGLTALENEIEKLPIFKRLQDISQLGLVKRIFPGALHNRYIHSLGVMHIADEMAKHLDRFSVAERQLLRLAGILHDLGHYPLSHDLEQVYTNLAPTITEDKNVTDIFLDDFISAVNEIKNQARKPDENDENKPRLKMTLPTSLYHHEAVTARVISSSDSILKIIERGVIDGAFDCEEPHYKYKWVNCSPKKAKAVATSLREYICAVIQGNLDYRPEYFGRYFSAIVQLMHSELDADRMDYLLRDATFSGASYGAFDLGLLLQNLAMTQLGTEEWVVGVKPKGIGCADQYMINRYLAYTQVIHHKYMLLPT